MLTKPQVQRPRPGKAEAKDKDFKDKDFKDKDLELPHQGGKVCKARAKDLDFKAKDLDSIAKAKDLELQHQGRLKISAVSTRPRPRVRPIITGWSGNL